MAYQVTRLFHPSHRVRSLADAEEFFERVFGRESSAMSKLPGDGMDPRYPRDYCTFTFIGDVFFDSIDPSHYVFEGVQYYEPITTPYLSGLGWHVEGIDDLWTELRRLGIRSTDQLNVLADADTPPEMVYHPTRPLFFTMAEDTGLRYEFMSTPTTSSPIDPRTDPSWTLPPVSPSDPLGIVRCSHHTILTNRTDRALKMLVTVLGGAVIHEGTNDVLHTQSTYVALADAIFELAEPLEPGSPVMQQWQLDAPNDTYHSLTWQVASLDRVAAQLEASNVGISTRTDTVLVADAADCLGIPWGFTTARIPHDPRTQR